MFKKVHLRLTLLCAGITAVIMLVMSLCYPYVSEKGLYCNQFQVFQNDINTISTNLEQQNVISMEWLSKMEARGNYRFFVLDNGVPFLFNQLNDPAGSGSSRLLLESRDSRNKLSESVPPAKPVVCFSPYKGSFPALESKDSPKSSPAATSVTCLAHWAYFFLLLFTGSPINGSIYSFNDIWSYSKSSFS